MPKSRAKAPKKKKPGRPATGHDPLLSFRLSADMIAAIDAWAASQPDRPTRSEALRRFIEVGMKALGALGAKRKARTRSEERA